MRAYAAVGLTLSTFKAVQLSTYLGPQTFYSYFQCSARFYVAALL